ncbi:MAG TPA: CAP domain-containing protein [Propionibacteriaceae bacterium]
MRTTRFVRRFAAGAIMVASAALPAGVAHSVDTGTAPVTTTQSTPLAGWVTSPKQVVVSDPGLPAKGAVAPVAKTPSVDTLTRDPVAPASTTPVVNTTTQTTKSTTTKTTTTKVTAKSTTSAAANTNKTSTISTPQAPAAVAPPATSGSVTSRQDLVGAVASATNAQRAAAGLAPLAYRSCSVPASFAVKLASEGALYHNSLTTVLSACGGKSTAGENIARGYTSVSAVTAGWMASAGHKANILNPSFKSISVGVAQAANGTYYWVENFVG